MTTELLLFALRLLSGLLLLALLALLFAALWRDVRGTAQDIEQSRRTYGRIVSLRELDGDVQATGDTYPLLPITSLGRSPTNTIRVDDTFASSEHAVVALRNGQWWLEDRHSRNGTLLNGLPVTQPIILTDGDIIGIGNLRFRLEMEK